ncbi:hypothetical protein PO878_17190 [Iamia majanohamensis]|uniref:Uncharacterized protein n=1 Tax=Iamia majanohamensis TaxID=467976 RepID=A0AAE9Y8F7_9ACTN|nr:hypothetical protein [Iamia majanohamensis]WCO66239.1 hypothetical protein PO878_17190 [Iamia majanohamensis]
MERTFADLVAANRDRPSPMLDSSWALQRLLDPEVSHLVRALEAHCGEWEVHQATQRLWQALPEQPGIYMFVWRPEFRFHLAGQGRCDALHQILYVGRSGGANSSRTLRDRYRDYLKFLSGSPERIWEAEGVSTRSSRLKRYLPLRPLEFWFSVVEDPFQVAPLEDRLIKVLNPPLNDSLTPKGRPKSPEPAFRMPST